MLLTVWITDGYLIYSAVLVSGVHQSDSVMRVFFFRILIHCRLLQGTEYSSLGYTVGPQCLPIFWIKLQALLVWACQAMQTPDLERMTKGG